MNDSHKQELVDTKQKSTEQVFVTPPQERNPTGKGGFGDHPENRNPGGWKKDESISYQYNKLMRMSPDELAVFEPETVAQKIALQRIQVALTIAGLNDTKEITDRTEGKSPQSIDLTSLGERLAPVAMVQFIGDTPEADDGNTDATQSND